MRKKLLALLTASAMLFAMTGVFAEPEDETIIGGADTATEIYVTDTDEAAEVDIPVESEDAYAPADTEVYAPAEDTDAIVYEESASEPVSAYAELSFTDVPWDAWYHDAVSFITSSGYMNGVSETEFEPESSMTRAMFVTVLGRMDGSYVGEYNKKIFEDVEPDLWYSQFVNWAFASNIVTGYDDLKFHPNDEVNRAQLAVMIKRYADFRGYSFADNPNAYDTYTDSDAIPEWAREGVDLMRRTGIITGDSYGSFMPQAVATRAQIAAIVMRMRRVMNGEVLDIPQRQVKPRVSSIMESMSLKDKIYQMIALTPDKLTKVNGATMASSATADAVASQPVGTIIYTGNNILGEEQIKEMISKTRSYYAIKPFIGISEEPGSGATLSSRIGKQTFKDAYDYRMSEPNEVHDVYVSLASTLKDCGFDLDLAPTADLWSNPASTYIAKRSFGNTYEECTGRTLAAIGALKETGILSAMKYFPGYGSSSDNPVDEKCVSERTIEDLRNYDFNTYKDDIDAGVDFVLCANIIMENIDPDNPAPMSEVLLNDILRNELGFKGIIMTDDFSVKAIAGYYTSADAAKRAVKAGCDIILCPDDPYEAASALISAVQNGEISENRINESVERILNKKLEAGIIQ